MRLILLIIQIFLIAEIASGQTICVVKGGDYPQYTEAIEGFWEVMGSSGYSKEKDSCEYHLAKDNQAKIMQAIKDKRPKLIFTVGNSAAKTFAESNVPVVFAMVLDPVKYKIVDSLENPGHNITGVTLDIPVENQLRAMKETIPNLRYIGVIYSANSAELVVKGREIVKEMGLDVITQAVREKDEVIKAFDRLLDSKIDILWFLPDSTVLRGRNKGNLLERAKQKKIPVYGLTTAYLKGEAGATLSVSADFKDVGKEAGESAIKVLNGATNIAVKPPRKSVIYVKENSGVKIPKGAVIIK
jgi:putative ABC transport system substrate-binding protein